MGQSRTSAYDSAEQRRRDHDELSKLMGRNVSAIEALLDEHIAGEHRIAHPDCPGCKAAAQMRRGQMPWEERTDV